MWLFSVRQLLLHTYTMMCNFHFLLKTYWCIFFQAKPISSKDCAEEMCPVWYNKEEGQILTVQWFFKDQYLTKTKTEEKQPEGSSWSSGEGQNTQYNRVSGLKVSLSVGMGPVAGLWVVGVRLVEAVVDRLKELSIAQWEAGVSVSGWSLEMFTVFSGRDRDFVQLANVFLEKPHHIF